MGFGVWGALLAAAVVGGCLTCVALFVRQRMVPAVGLCATAATAATVYLLWRIGIAASRADATIAAAFLALGAGGGGFALAAALAGPLTRRQEPAPIPAAPLPDDGMVHVVLLADCEPEDYDPRAVTRVLDELQAADAPMPPELARPLVYAAERSRYRRQGHSPSRSALRSIAGRVAARLSEARREMPVEVAFCSGEDRLAIVAARLFSAGMRRVAVVPVTVAWTSHFEDAIASTTQRGRSLAGTRFEVGDTLASSNDVTSAIAERVAAAMAPDPGAVGVCLVSPGQPEEIQALSRREAEETTYFVQRVRAALIDRGLASELIRQGWIEWQDPDVAEVARHIAAMGAHAVAIVPVTIPLETLDTVSDLKIIAGRATAETGARVEVLPAWGEERAVVEALVERALVAVERLGEDS